MSSGPTDRRAAALLLAAALAAAGHPGPARADGTVLPDRPVFFRDPDPATARDIRNAISLFGSPSPSDRERARNTLHDIGYWSVDRPLLEALDSKGAQHRSNAALVLGRLGDPRALGPLRALVTGDASEWPTSIAALMLGRMRDADDRTLAAYRAAIASERVEKRKIAVALALGKLHRRRGTDAGPLLDQILDTPTPTPFVHYAALLALGFYRSRVAEPLPDGSGYAPSARIRAALADSREGTRLSAVLALAVSRLDGFETVFLEAFRRDGDRDVRRTALLALGKPGDGPDDAVTDLLTSVLESPRTTGEERRTAAYLLSLRQDPRSVDALLRVAQSPRAPEVAAMAVVALGGIADPRVPELLAGKLGDRSATIRAAAAVGATRLGGTEDLLRLREALKRKLEQGETDRAARFDMNAAVEEIGRILRDREEAAQGRPVKPRSPPEWMEADATDLFRSLGRSHREAVLDAANARVLQVLGIDSLLEYRPLNDPLSGSGGGDLGGASRFRREHLSHFEAYDLSIELTRRPYYGLEDYPDAEEARPPVPRAPR